MECKACGRPVLPNSAICTSCGARVVANVGPSLKPAPIVAATPSVPEPPVVEVNVRREHERTSLRYRLAQNQRVPREPRAVLVPTFLRWWVGLSLLSVLANGGSFLLGRPSFLIEGLLSASGLALVVVAVRLKGHRARLEQEQREIEESLAKLK